MSSPLWIEGRPVSLDANGPTDVRYDSLSARDFETVGGVEVIERIARQFPHKIAVDDGNLRLTYEQFVGRAYDAAELLLSATEPGQVVASLVANTAASPIIIMACAISGRILVPIYANHPVERQKAIFAESGARAVLVAKDQPVDDGFIPASIPRLIVDPTSEKLSGKPACTFDHSAPLFVSFTSGSTGRPKGVVSGGRYSSSALRHFIDMFHLNASDVLLGLASLSTGGSRDAFLALGVGATIRLFDMKSGGIAELLRVMEQDKITC